MSKEMLKGLIELVPEEDIETLSLLPPDFRIVENFYLIYTKGNDKI